MESYRFLDDIFNKFSDGRVYYKTYSLMPDESIKPSSDYELNIVKDGAYFIFEVPGFNKTNLEVLVEGPNLVLTGTRKYKLNGKEQQKTLNKKVELSQNMVYDSSLIEASVEDGILTVFIPNYNQESVKKKNKINLS
jgi:HSP20 family molecular chaperone IbpA